MDSTEYELMYRVESNHWWYRGMRKVMTRLFTSYHTPESGELKILDAGCGTGAGMLQFSKFGHVVGVDLSPLAISFCKMRDLSALALASLSTLPFRDGCFDVITCMDVLYEDSIPDDQRSVAELNRITRPDGLLILRLPAYPWLMGNHDRIVHTHKRYTRKEVISLLAASGYQVLFSSYANCFLFPLVLVKRLSDRVFHPKRSQSDLTYSLPIIDSILEFFLSLEATIIPKHTLPFGSSVIAVGRKVSQDHA